MRAYPASWSQLSAWIGADKRVLAMGHLPPARVRLLTDEVRENEARLTALTTRHRHALLDFFHALKQGWRHDVAEMRINDDDTITCTVRRGRCAKVMTFASHSPMS